MLDFDVISLIRSRSRNEMVADETLSMSFIHISGGGRSDVNCLFPDQPVDAFVGRLSVDSVRSVQALLTEGSWSV